VSCAAAEQTRLAEMRREEEEGWAVVEAMFEELRSLAARFVQLTARSQVLAQRIGLAQIGEPVPGPGRVIERLRRIEGDICRRTPTAMDAMEVAVAVGSGARQSVEEESVLPRLTSPSTPSGCRATRPPFPEAWREWSPRSPGAEQGDQG
jgi:hypothetical protein